MAKKTQNNEAPSAEVRPGEGVAVPGVGSAEVVPVEDREREDRLFKLYLARVATIDRYRVPITDKGLSAAYRKALDEATVALSVFENKGVNR